MRLLNPRTIAVIGGKECERVVDQCDKFGFTGTIWPVHPTRETLSGRACFKSIADLPEAPDAAYVAVKRERSIDIVAQLSARGAGGAVCYAAGFAEADGESAGSGDLQKALVEAAGDMPIIGPNCYGFINTLERVALWPDQHGAKACDSGVAILTQSSNVAINLTMQKRGLPVAQVMTVGNQAQLGLSDLGLALLEDERISALGLHIEGLDDVKAFERFALRARQLRKPIVVIKVGKSEQAQAAAMTHTASLAGSDAAHEALFRRLGVARVDTLEAFIETLKLFHVHGALHGGELLSLSCSGGEASLMADAAQGRAVSFPAFDESTAQALKSALGEIVSIANPLDYNTFIWGDWPAMTRMFEAALSPRFDLAMLVIDFPRHDLCDPYDWVRAADAFIAAVKQIEARAAIVASLPETMPEELAEDLIVKGIVPLCGLDTAIIAAQAAAFVGAIWSKPEPKPLLALSPLRESVAVTLNEWEAKQELAAAGLIVPKGVFVSDMNGVDAALRSLTFPLAAKALGIAHKTEAGAVSLNLKTSQDLLHAISSLSRLSKSFLIEEMAQKPTIEIIVGVTRDPVVGLLLTIGAGGILAEIMDDTASLLLPANEGDIRAALASLKINPLLEGYRGADAADIDALVANIWCIANYAAEHADTLEELDVNPLFATPFGSVAVDALIVKRTKTP
ncbi:acetate--CoA ligase family protein [Pseudahrensia aquimaris]|uniref:Acetate--CoA ligase family protein n=1 Tax=Pseudahrensia aquimaris TaxID=744461 RepID=A0ABW3FDX4_9HYPH